MKYTKSLKRAMAVLLAAMIFFAGSMTMITAKADTTMKTTTAVNLRKEASSTSAKITVVPEGAKVTVVSTSNAKWYKVTYNGKTGFIYSKYLGNKQTANETKIMAEDLNMRSSMSKANNKNIIKVIPKGAVVTILSKEADMWYKVSYGGKTGYIKGGHFTDDTSRMDNSSSSSTETKKMAEDLKMRSSKSKSSDSNLIQIIPKGAKVTILSKESDGWYKVKYNGKTGYIMGGHFTDDTSRMGVGATQKVTKTMAEDLNMRSSCSKKDSSNIIKVIPKNGKVTILENCADNWFKVDYKGTVGYIKGGHFK
ncbi:MAG: hypothetical protein E7240_02060 [Lachnospiraceae bacterium]|nr:hypothetical protein [Lachnospiraceae bacterium]